MTMRMRQLLVALGIAVILIWAILMINRPSDRLPVPSLGPSPTGGIGVPASTSIPSASGVITTVSPSD